jgi:hypothetical protein
MTVRRRLPGLVLGVVLASAGTLGVVPGAPAQAGAADGGKPHPVGTLGSGPAPAGFADWDQMWAYQARLNAGAEQILAAGDAGNPTIVANPTSHELSVYWHGTVPAKVRATAGRLGVPVSFHPAAYTRRELVTEARRLVGTAGIVSAAPAADGSGLAVTVENSPAPAAQASPRGAERPPLSITVGKRPQAMIGRQIDTPPFWGGSRYSNSRTTAVCSNGIPIKIGGVLTMLTAAHCGAIGDFANIPNLAAHAGSFANLSACRDNALIEYSQGVQPRIYTGAPTSFTSAQVVGATTDFLGNFVVTGGASSGEHVNLTVVAIDQFNAVGGIPCGTVGPLTAADASSGACAVAPGDSGGPVYSYLGSDVLARGAITAGGSAGVSCPGAFPNGNQRVLYAPLLIPAGDAALGALAVYHATAPTASTFDLNGTWTDGRGPGPVITEAGRTLTVDMSRFNRPTAHGTVIDDTDISVTFPDDKTYTGQLRAPGTILWSNNSVWTKL